VILNFSCLLDPLAIGTPCLTLLLANKSSANPPNLFTFVHRTVKNTNGSVPEEWVQMEEIQGQPQMAVPHVPKGR
jgi:hypothetical protein